MSDPIPVTLLTSFLAAGRTTHLNLLLRDPAAGRVAVVVNEFGEAGLDHVLDLSGYGSGHLRAIFAIEETGHGRQTQR